MHYRKAPRRAEVMTLVVSSMRDVLSEKDESPSDPMGEFTYLIGSKSVLDSLGLVTLVVELEQRLEEEYGVPLVLADDSEIVRKNSPFQTVKSLTDYICSLIAEKRQND